MPKNRGVKKYWSDIHAIQAEKSCNVEIAKQIYRERQPNYVRESTPAPFDAAPKVVVSNGQASVSECIQAARQAVELCGSVEQVRMSLDWHEAATA